MNRMTHFMQLAALIGFLATGAQAAETVPADRFDLSFPGGSLVELIRTMETAGGKKLNVLLPQDGASVSVPKLELREVTAENVFLALNRTAFEREQRIAIDNVRGVWVLMKAPEIRTTKVFYVGHLLGKLKIEDVTTAIQTTWEFGSKESNATCLDELEPDERALIEAFYFQVGSHRSLAEQHQTTVKAVESKLARTRKKLRTAILKRLCHENS